MSLAEIFAKAGMNTILGMGVVFSVLIFISFLISLFKYLPGLIEQFHTKKVLKVEVEDEKAQTVCEKPAVSESPKMDEGLTIAIITAAIQAAINDKQPEGDAYFVRAIRRV